LLQQQVLFLPKVGKKEVDMAMPTKRTRAQTRSSDCEMYY